MTPLKAVENAHHKATSTWTDASWTHEYRVDGSDMRDKDGEPIYCSGEEDCSTCRDATSDAESAESEGAEALTAAQAGLWDAAVEHAEAAARLEQEWGDDPTWGAFVDAVKAAAETAAYAAIPGPVYGIASEDDVTECVTLEEAEEMWTRGEGTLVELEGRGPVYASDGEEIAECHAPRRTIKDAIEPTRV